MKKKVGKERRKEGNERRKEENEIKRRKKKKKFRISDEGVEGYEKTKLSNPQKTNTNLQ